MKKSCLAVLIGLFMVSVSFAAVKASVLPSNGGSVVVEDTNAAYPVPADQYVQAAKLTASDRMAGDRLGTSVAVSSDGTLIVVGAYGATVGGNPMQGAVYVFKESASGWSDGTQVAKLTASDGAALDYLGSTVAVSADGATIVAGASGATVGGNIQQGAVYVFKEPASGWADETQTARLTVSDGAAGAHLGWTVAVTPDGATVVAGANDAAVGSNKSQGAAYVFKEPASGWANETQAAELTASDGAANDNLGVTVALSSNGATVVADAYNATVGGNTHQGAVYVFKEPASGWADETQAAKLTASDGAANDTLGCPAISPDGATVVAGAPGAAVGGNLKQGALYVFKEPASGWTDETQTARLTASDGAALDTLGDDIIAVSSNGITVVAGALGATVGGNSAQGAVYVFKEPASGWTDETQTAKLTAADGAADGLLSDVAATPDGSLVVAGAVGADNFLGAAYVFQGSLWQNAMDYADGVQYSSWFGYFNTNSTPWIRHSTLGWLRPCGTTTQSIWFYDMQWDGTGGWWWTSASAFPWIYSASDGQWFYYDAAASTPGARWFCTSGGCAMH